jgi:hypothetical protein
MHIPVRDELGQLIREDTHAHTSNTWSTLVREDQMDLCNETTLKCYSLFPPPGLLGAGIAVADCHFILTMKWPAGALDSRKSSTNRSS